MFLRALQKITLVLGWKVVSRIFLFLEAVLFFFPFSQKGLPSIPLQSPFCPPPGRCPAGRGGGAGTPSQDRTGTRSAAAVGRRGETPWTQKPQQAPKSALLSDANGPPLFSIPRCLF